MATEHRPLQDLEMQAALRHGRQEPHPDHGESVIGRNQEVHAGICTVFVQGLCIALSYLIALVVVFIPFLWPMCIRVIKEYERAVHFRFGKLIGAKGPGLITFLPCVDTFRIVDLRTVAIDVPSQEMITKDSVTVHVNAVIYMRVFDSLKAVNEVDNFRKATTLYAQTALRSVVGESELDELLCKRAEISRKLASVIDQYTDPWGVRVPSVEVKDVRLPPVMQRAMAMQAEAERSRRAKIIAAEGELGAATQLAEAARIMASDRSALQLRYLQTLTTVAAEKNSTILFPIPLDLISAFMKRPEQDVVLSKDTMQKALPQIGKFLTENPDIGKELAGSHPALASLLPGTPTSPDMPDVTVA